MFNISVFQTLTLTSTANHNYTVALFLPINSWFYSYLLWVYTYIHIAINYGHRSHILYMVMKPHRCGAIKMHGYFSKVT